MTAPARPAAPIGTLLRTWRQRRRYSQLALACDAGISTKHLSFVESGRARPSREMLLHLAEHLEVPLRERNVMLLSAGYAPVFEEHSLDSPALARVREAVELVLKGHEPYPAIAVDRHWTLMAANRAVAPLLAGAAAPLLEPPVNVLRLSLHPQGLAPRIANLAQWRAHLFLRLGQQIERTGDATLARLLEELRGLPGPDDAGAFRTDTVNDVEIFVPLRLRTEHGVLSLMSTTMIFGTPVDITASELAIESFFPADDATAALLRGA